MNDKEESILKSPLFFKLFGIPSITWLVISLLAMIPVDTDSDPLTWGDLIIADIVLLSLWFTISSLIALIVNNIKKNKSKNIDEIKYENITEEKTIIVSKEIQEELKKYNHPNLIKSGMIILFIITIASLWLSLYSVLFINMLNPQYGSGFTKNMWICWCWLAVPIISIILGFKYKRSGFKCTKNIVGGFIIGFLLLIYGAFCFFPTFQEEYSKIDTYRDIIDANLPNNGYLEIHNFETYFDEDKTEYTIVNAYYDKEDVSDLISSIKNNDNWILSNEIKSVLKIFIPSTLRLDDDAYFSIYNNTTNQYNTLPETSGDYEIYAMKYDKSEKKLEIHKFKYSYK